MSISPADADWAARYEAMCAGGGIGLVHQYFIHNVAIETSLRRLYGRDDWAAALVEEGTGLVGEGVVRTGAWVGASAPGRAIVVELDWKVAHTGSSPIFGPATGRSAVLSSTMIGLLEGERVHRAWRVVDYAAAARELGVDIDNRARTLAKGAPKRGGIPWEFGEVRTGLGQTAPPASVPAPPGLAPECVALCTQFQAAWNQRRFDLLPSFYDTNATILSGAEAIDVASLRHPWALIVGACPDAVLFFERAVTCLLGSQDRRVALVWRWVGGHSGQGLGTPSGRRLHVRGLTVLHLHDGRVMSERVVCDGLGIRRDAVLRETADEVPR